MHCTRVNFALYTTFHLQLHLHSHRFAPPRYIMHIALHHWSALQYQSQLHLFSRDFLGCSKVCTSEIYNAHCFASLHLQCTAPESTLHFALLFIHCHLRSHCMASQSHTWNCIYAVSIENTAAEIYAAIIDALHYSIIHTALKSAKHQNLTNALCAMHEVVSVLYLCVDVVRCVLCVVNAQQTSPS